MLVLATELVPEAIEQYLTRYPNTVVQHHPHRTSEKNYYQSQAA
jgi:hypothetical protein